MRRIARGAAMLWIVVVAILLPDGHAQPPPFARFVAMKDWQVQLELVYDSRTPNRTEHATSNWTGVLHRDESFWQGDAAPDELRWYGDMEIAVDGTVKLVSDNCRTTITSQGPDKYSFALTITKTGYKFGQGYCGTDFGTSVTRCPGKPDHVDEYGSVNYSPQSWQVVRALPARGGELSDSTTLDDKSPNQVEGEALRPGQRLKVSWKFSPVQDFVCGPDVTLAVMSTLGEMTDYFKQLVPENKIAHCRALHDSWVGARAWDISRLCWKNASWLDSYTNLGTCDVPGDGVTDDKEDPGTCKHSVRHSGKCVLAGTLNYFAYGQMHRLCYDYAVTQKEHRDQHLLCVIRRGGCPSADRPGFPTEGDTKTYNDLCSSETGYPGVVTPTPDECTHPPTPPDPGDVLNPTDWDKPAMDWYIEKYKEATLSWGDIAAPTAFANAAFDSGVLAVPPIENRARCKTKCPASHPVMPPFLWTWYPGHIAP
jgi:hypothetical protein